MPITSGATTSTRHGSTSRSGRAWRGSSRSLLVVILALPFALGPMRSSGQGARTVIGILIGAGFMLLSQTLESGGQLIGVPPWLVGWSPTFGLAALTGVLLWRTR